MASFISGLHREIQRDVNPKKLESINQAATLDKLFEERYTLVYNSDTKESYFPPNISPITNVGKFTATTEPAEVFPTLNSPQPSILSTPSNASQPMKKISSNEMQLRRA